MRQVMAGASPEPAITSKIEEFSPEPGMEDIKTSNLWYSR
jgi:hypothetical protein